jgi:hypothetical protein
MSAGTEGLTGAVAADSFFAGVEVELEQDAQAAATVQTAAMSTIFFMYRTS